MKAKWCIAPLLAALVMALSTSCNTLPSLGGNSTSKTNKALMGMSVGMNKSQVYQLAGTAAKIEGYDWGSVWFYKTATGGGVNVLLDGNEEENFTPVVFDNSNRVTGYGWKFYSQTIRDYGTGQF
ncbi:MAG: hypothetical protein CMI31_01160 [Opitutae bacterium]|jgi:outer membrane protein assembly factor BamE (lipoprotein component of BamABCDE complex)|nr:hypothetical protein [Opitutae bacterium]|tara:strand:+ start:963 stop:1337 length:375 start_codon:yes stop_codon:yes gene_type:complete